MEKISLKIRNTAKAVCYNDNNDILRLCCTGSTALQSVRGNHKTDSSADDNGKNTGIQCSAGR